MKFQEYIVNLIRATKKVAELSLEAVLKEDLAKKQNKC
jgi:hypothetical protein